MPFQIKCNCGKVLQVPDSAGGKRIKCPSCEETIAVPEPETEAEQDDEMSLSLDTDEEGERGGAGPQQSDSVRTCSNCGAELEPDQNVCFECGFNDKTGVIVKAHAPNGGDSDSSSTPSVWTVAAIAGGGGIVVIGIIIFLLFFVFADSSKVQDQKEKVQSPKAPRRKKVKNENLLYLPARATIIGRVRMDKLLSIPAIKDRLQGAEDRTGYELFKSAGMSPETVQDVYFAVDAMKQEAGALIVTSGEVDEGKLQNALKETGAVQEKTSINGYSAYRLEEKKGTAPVLVILDNRRLALGTEAMAKAMIEAKDADESVVDKSRLMAICEEGTLPDLVWAAMRLSGEDMKKLGKAAGPSSPVNPRDIDSALIQAEYDQEEGLLLAATVGFVSRAAAKKAAPKFDKTAKRMGQSFLKDKKDALTVGQDGAHVKLELQLPGEILDKLSEDAQKRARLAMMSPDRRRRYMRENMVGPQIRRLRSGSKQEKKMALRYFATHDFVEQAQLGKSVQKELLRLFLDAKTDTDLASWASKAIQRLRQSAGFKLSPDTVQRFIEVQKHLNLLEGKASEQKKGLAFFLDYEKPLKEHRDEVLYTIVQIVKDVGDSDGEKGDNLQSQAVKTLRKINPKTLQAAFPTLSRFMDEVYLPFASQPVIRDGTLFFYSRKKSALVALDLDTWAELWRNKYAPRGKPVYHNGKVYCGGACVEPTTGKVLWRYDKFGLDSTVMVPHGRTLYFAVSNTRYVCALDAETGEERWRLDVGQKTTWRCPPFFHDGTLYCLADANQTKGLQNNTLAAIDADQGEVKWVYSFKRGAIETTRFAFDARRLFFDGGGKLLAINAGTGRRIGKTRVITRKPIIVGDVMFGYQGEPVTKGEDESALPAIVALNLRTTTTEWRTSLGEKRKNPKVAKTQDPAIKVPPIYLDGRLYFFMRDPEELLCFKSESGELLWRYEAKDIPYPPHHPMTIYKKRIYFVRPQRIFEIDRETGEEVRRPLPSGILRYRKKLAKNKSARLNIPDHVPDEAEQIIRNAYPAFSQSEIDAYAGIYTRDRETRKNAYDDITSITHPRAPELMKHHLQWLRENDLQGKGDVTTPWRYVVEKKEGTDYGRVTVPELISYLEVPGAWNGARRCLSAINWIDRSNLQKLRKVVERGEYATKEFIIASQPNEEEVREKIKSGEFDWKKDATLRKRLTQKLLEQLKTTYEKKMQEKVQSLTLTELTIENLPLPWFLHEAEEPVPVTQMTGLTDTQRRLVDPYFSRREKGKPVPDHQWRLFTTDKSPAEVRKAFNSQVFIGPLKPDGGMKGGVDPDNNAVTGFATSSCQLKIGAVRPKDADHTIVYVFLRQKEE